MKSLLAICTLFLAAALVRGDMDKTMEKFMEVTKEHFVPCAAEAGLPSDLPSLMQPHLMEPEKLEKLNCVNACVLKKLGIMDGGKIVADKMMEFIQTTFPEETADMAKKAEGCIAEANGASDDCGVMKAFGECMKKLE